MREGQFRRPNDGLQGLSFLFFKKDYRETMVLRSVKG